MRIFIVRKHEIREVLEELNHELKGDLQHRWGETRLEFDNEYGRGVIRGIAFDWGVSHIDYDVSFKEETKIVFQIQKVSPIEFVFISEGGLRYKSETLEDYMKLERYQNVIISPEPHSRKRFIFPKKVRVKVNFIQIVKREYLKKKNHNLNYLNELLLSIFKEAPGSLPYNHYGNYNLKIADEVRKLAENNDNGIIRTLSIEGRLNLILAMQLLEHHNFETKKVLPESLSHNDIKRIQQLTDFIVDNIADPLTVASLSRESGISPKKLQLGFKMLFSKSVNEYIRQLKLEIARDLLKNTDLTVSEVVYKVGIKSRSYFSKIFFERYGILPNEYRKDLKKVT